MAVTWNPAYITNGGVPSLTNGNLTVTNTSGGTSFVLVGSSGFSANNLYWELQTTTLGTNEWGVGWGPLAPSNYTGNVPGYYSQGLISYRNGAQVLTGGSAGAPIGTAPGFGTPPAYMGIAFQPSSGKIWFSADGTTWNAGSGASPGGTGGYTGTGSGWAVPFTPIIYMGSGAGSLSFTANFGATPFHFVQPGGFNSLTNPSGLSQSNFFFVG